MYAWPHWLTLENLYEVDYSEKMLKSIIVTSFAKKKLSILTMLLFTMLFKIHINSLLCFFFSFNYYVDFGIQILIPVIINLKSNFFYKVVANYEHSFFNLTQYFVDNYTPENYRKWKRILVFVSCLYLLIILSLVDINSNMLITYIFQYMLTFIIIDQIEQKKLEKFIQNLKDRPKKVIYGELNLVEDFYNEPECILFPDKIKSFPVNVVSKFINKNSVIKDKLMDKIIETDYQNINNVKNENNENNEDSSKMNKDEIDNQLKFIEYDNLNKEEIDNQLNFIEYDNVDKDDDNLNKNNGNHIENDDEVINEKIQNAHNTKNELRQRFKNIEQINIVEDLYDKEEKEEHIEHNEQNKQIRVVLVEDYINR